MKIYGWIKEQVGGGTTLRAFSKRLSPKRLATVRTHVHAPRRATASSLGAARVRCLAQGHVDTQL